MTATLLDRPTIDDALTRRDLFVAAGVAAALAGCGRSTAPAPAAPGGGFPRTLDTALGPVTLPAPPQRVVTLGSAETDTAVALGMVPAAASQAFGTPDGISNWLRPALAGASLPTLDLNAGPQLERIAAARPDVILAPSYTSLDETLDDLRRIAPVIGSIRAPFVDTWQDQTMLVGRALGREDRAAELVAQVDDGLRARGAAHPGWRGRTITYGVQHAAAATRVFAVQRDKSMFVFTERFGLSVPQPLQQLGAQRNLNGTVDIGPERLGLLEADALLLTYTSPDLRAQLEADPLFRRLDVVRRGSYAAVDRAGGGALREPSVLSLPYAADELERALVRTLG